MQIPYVFRATGALLLAGLSFTAETFAQTTYTWDGSSDGNWGTAANWTGNVAPVDAGTAPENIVRFDNNSTANLLTTMNLTSGFDLSQIIVTNPTGTITIRAVNNSSRVIDLWANGSNPTIDMSTATQDLIFANQGSGTMTLNVANTSQTWNVGGGRTLTTSDVDGSTAQILTLTGGGTIILGGTTDNASLRVTVSGNTLVTLGKTASTAAIHALGGNATSVIDNGSTMRITGTGGDQVFFQHDLQVDGVFDLNGQSEGIDALSSAAGSATGIITSGAVGNVTLRINENGAGGTYGGIIQDGGGVVSVLKAHTGTQVFAGNNTYNGSTTVSRGILQLLGASGALSGTSSIILDGTGELRLDSRSTSGGFAAAVNNNRVADDATVDMRGGIFSVYGVSTADVSETVGALSITSGFNVIRLSSDTVAGTTTTGLTLSGLSRSIGATLGVMADNLTVATDFGTVTTGADAAYLRVVTGNIASSMISGASGTGTERDILIGVFGSGSTTNANASDFMTVESGIGGYDYLRPLLASEYATATSGEIGQKNALSTANTTLNLSTAYNALKISGGALSIGANKTLFLGGHAGSGSEGSGMLLITGGTGITGGLTSLATLDFGAREAIIRVTSATANIDAHITGTKGLTKSGTSALVLNNSNSFSGAVYVTEGTLQVKNDKALGAAGGHVFVGSGGTASNSLFQLSTGVNITGENVTLGVSNASQSVAFGSASGHNTWGGDVIASNTGLGGRSDSDSQIQASGAESSLTIYGRVYAAQGDTQTDLTYYGNDSNFTRRISFSGSSTGTINLYGTLSDTATGVSATAVDRLRVNMTGNEQLNVNIANQVQVTGIFHMIQGYMRYEGTGNFFDPTTSGTDRLVLFDPAGTASQIALLLTKDGQSFYRRTAAGATDIQIGNGGSGVGTSVANALIGGENETGVVTFGSGVQHMEFNPVTAAADVGRFRDLRLYARQGGEVEIKMSMSDDSGFALNNEIGALTKVGLGTVRLTGRSGVNNDLDGGVYALGGTLLLDYNTVNNVKIQAAEGAQFTTAGGDLRLIKGSAGSGAITELMSGSLAVRTGGSEISLDAGAGATLSLRLATNTGATITRQNGGTLNFVKSGLGTSSIKVGLAAIQNTRLGSYATFGTANNQATSWAFVSAGTNEITSYTHSAGEINTFGAGLNTDLTTSNVTLGAATTTNSIRLNDSAVTSIGLGGNQLTITEGGILVGSGHTAALSISNGTITTGGTNDLIIHNYGTGGLTISADIVGATQSVTYAGTGITTLSGAKTYTGTTYLVGGTVSIASDGSLGNAANAMYFNGGTLQTTATMTIARGITIGGDAAFIDTNGAANVTTLSGVINREGNFIYNETNASVGAIINAANTDNVGVGDIIKTGAGTLVISGTANLFSGVVDVRQGTLQIVLADVTAAQGNLGTNESWLDGTIIRSGATLAINKLGTANITTFAEWIRMENNTRINVTGGRFTTSGLMEVQGALTIDVASGAQFDQQSAGGYMFGNGNITKTGLGTWMLLGNNTLFTGALTVENGILGARGQGMITGSDFSELITVGGTGTTAEYRRFSANEFTNNQLVENHNFLITGTGVKRIGYGNGSVPNGDDFIDFNGTITVNTAVELNVDTPGGTRSQTAYMRFNNSFLGAANASTRVAGGTGTFTRTGVFELNGDNSAWSGGFTVGNATATPLNMHVLRLGNNDALKSDNNVTLLHNSTLQAGGRTVTAGNLTTSGNVGATSNEIVENAAHADGTIAFTQTTNGNWDATFRDGTPVGTVYEQDGNTTVGKLNIVKEGSAIATLTLDNLYTGSTTVNAGTLQVGSGGSATNRAVGDTGTGATSSVLTVNSGGRVAGTGTVQGVASSTTHFVTGTISPGDIVSGTSTTGTLDVVGNLNVSGGTIHLQAANNTTNDSELSVYQTGTAEYSQRIIDGISEWESSANGTTRGDHDMLNIDGQLTLDSNSTVNVEFLTYLASAGDIFDLMDWVGSLGGSFDVGANFRNGGNGGGDLYLPTLSAGLVYDLSRFNTNGIIIVANVGVVPEPGRVLLLMLGATSLVLRRRRRTVR
ncbi:autotransporter-associated beta strand repeat-containing protein [Roseimicrobium sp. ORNL1]|uniref:autotransporter-associated beta strand repeat-containing protein n=1 Tax=Roseimicrobium sp. ORNL1 TaxID=2711231 RepID=UPI0013E14A21|nr:autotransporter-associated beta strand repeat-containing protein [Roseimicrobium sp. ORNL1]QIF00576.1 PEP-CTERM sorting domain-containing protein [Roseimicrobium sp. ORNL1]